MSHDDMMGVIATEATEASSASSERDDLQRQLATSIADLTRYMDAFASQTESRERSRRDSYGY